MNHQINMCTSVTSQWLHTGALLPPGREMPGQGGSPLLRTLTAASRKAFPEVCCSSSLCVRDILPFRCTKALVWTPVTPVLHNETTKPADRRANVAFWAWGSGQGCHNTHTSELQYKALPSANPYLSCPPCASVMTGESRSWCWGGRVKALPPPTKGHPQKSPPALRSLCSGVQWTPTAQALELLAGWDPARLEGSPAPGWQRVG